LNFPQLSSPIAVTRSRRDHDDARVLHTAEPRIFITQEYSLSLSLKHTRRRAGALLAVFTLPALHGAIAHIISRNEAFTHKRKRYHHTASTSVK